jgi:hypothetical protein
MEKRLMGTTTIEEAQREVIERKKYNESLGARGKLEQCSPAARTFTLRVLSYHNESSRTSN